MGDLYDEIGRMLSEYLKPSDQRSAQGALDEVVDRIQALMARTR